MKSKETVSVTLTILLALTITGCRLGTPFPTVTIIPVPTATSIATTTTTPTVTTTPTATTTATSIPSPTATPPINIEECLQCAIEPEIEGLRLRSTFSEATLNELLAPQLANAVGVRNVYIDIVPGGAVIRTGVNVLGRWLSVDADTLLDVQEGTLLIYILEASVGPIGAPGVAIDIINDQVTPSINTVIYNTIQQYNPIGIVYLTNIECTNTDLTVEYVVRPPG